MFQTVNKNIKRTVTDVTRFLHVIAMEGAYSLHARWLFVPLLSDSFVVIDGGLTRVNALQYLFETMSDFGMIGLSMGITSFLRITTG